MSEYVYILSNLSMPGIIKVGRTNRPIEERLKELNSATGVPTPFVLEQLFETNNSHTLEHLIHKDLEPFRVSVNREFFEISPTEAAEHISASYKDQKNTNELALLYLRQGKWEIENLPFDEWSDRASHYQDYISSQKAIKEAEMQEIRKICDTAIYEVDKYPQELWSPKTIEIVNNLESGILGKYETAYNERRELLKTRVFRHQKLLNRKVALYQEFGYQYLEDDSGGGISIFSNKHPDFISAISNKEFVSRLQKIRNKLETLYVD